MTYNLAPTYNTSAQNNCGYSETFFYSQPTGAAVNLTGYGARMQLRTSPSSATVVLELNVGNGGIVMGGTAGTIQVIITEAQLAALTAGTTYSFDLVLLPPTGDPIQLLGPNSTIEILQGVTR